MMHHGELETAFALLTAGNTSSARNIITKVLKDDPKNKQGLLLLSDIDQADGNPEQALKICHTLIALYPDDEDVRSALIDQLSFMRKHKEARAELKNFVRDFPHSTEITYLRTILSIYRNDFSALKANVKKLRSERGDTVYINLVEAYLADAKGSSREAFKRATHAVTLEPTNSYAHSIAARSAFRTFRLSSARNYARAALQNDPENIEMRSIRRLSIACMFPPVFIAYCALCFLGLPIMNAGPSFNLPNLWMRIYTAVMSGLRILLFIILMLAVTFALEAIGISSDVFFAVIGLSAFYIIIEFSLFSTPRKARQAATVDLRDY